MGRAIVFGTAFLNSDRTQGDLGQSLTSDWLDIDGREFSLQLVWTGAATPIGVLSYESTNDGATADAIDPSLLTPTPVDLTGPAGHQTIHFSGIKCRKFRVKYTRTSGGAADTLKGFVVPGKSNN